MSPEPSPARDGGVHTFLQQKIQENEELMEYLATQERVCLESKERAESLESRLRETEQHAALLEERVAKHERQDSRSFSDQGTVPEATADDERAEFAALEQVEELRGDAAQWKRKAEQYEDMWRNSQLDAEHWQEEAIRLRAELKRLQPPQQLEEDTEESAERVDDCEDGSAVSDLQREVDGLKVQLADAQQKQRSQTPPEAVSKELKLIASERDTLRMVVRRQRQHLVELTAHLPPLPPPASPPVAPASTFAQHNMRTGYRSTQRGDAPEGVMSDCWYNGMPTGCRSEAPSRTSGADTPSMPDGLTASANSSNASSPLLQAYSEAPSEYRGRSSSRLSSAMRACSASTRSLYVSDHSSDTVALSISPAPTRSHHSSFLPLPAAQALGGESLSSSHHVTFSSDVPRSRSPSLVRTSSYASQLGGGKRLSPSVGGTSTKTKSPPASCLRNHHSHPRKDRRQASSRGPSSPRAYAPLVLID
eukprot:TRINITY_DN5266_c2_g1_i1.p1 TRINITY_DN5266_c2_g1~~TRINITY_DN5266_c2_g1_i1.p1  ORF type:complete len:479 (+),score=148.87 TRINITY_DN5266_c2_g1_i1:61-1497(+)